MTGRKMVVTLFVVALVCSIILSYVYSYTAPRIEKTRGQMTLDGLREVISATEFVEVIPDTLWRAIDSSGNFVGIVFRVFPQGYGGAIPITVGLDSAGSITGIRIASAAEGLKETPGLGVKITEVSFTKQFTGKCASAVQLKKNGGEIDGITAATISSRAVCNGVQQGIEKYFNYMDKSVDKKCVFPDAQDFMEIIKDTLWYAVRGTDTLGIVFLGVTDGYADRIEFLVGVDKDAKITGVRIIYSNETPGYGERIIEKEFLDAFKEKYPDAISGATVSSQALINAVKDYTKRFKEYVR
jgi:electron transport complex protein RnfG